MGSGMWLKRKTSFLAGYLITLLMLQGKKSRKVAQDAKNG
jgi:hypothetical protein